MHRRSVHAYAILTLGQHAAARFKMQSYIEPRTGTPQAVISINSMRIHIPSSGGIYPAREPYLAGHTFKPQF